MAKKLMKVAYKTPPQENWNAFRDSTQTNPNFITDEQYALLKEAGFTHGLGLLEHGADIALRALEVAQRQGLKYFVRDEINWADILHKDFYYLNAENYKKYMTYESFAGVYIHDEPNASKYPKVAEMVQGYYDFFKGVGEPIVNLLPTYANHIEQLGANDYPDYIRRYLEIVPTPYVMYDHYPFRGDRNAKPYFISDYLYNVHVVASLAKEYGKEVRTFVQSCETEDAEGGFTAEMLWMQAHTHLAHGSKGLFYYYYWGDELGAHNGMMDWNGKPTHVYYAAKTLHEQIAQYEEELMECVWEKTLLLKGEKGSHNEEAFSLLDIPVGSELFSSEYDAIVGVLNYKGKKAYYAVNYNTPLLGLTNKLTVKLKGKYEVYVNGAKTELTDGGEISLGVGGGAFLLPKEV